MDTLTFTDGPLGLAFAGLLGRLDDGPATPAARLMARAALATLNSEAFDLAELEELSQEDQALMGQIFDALLAFGLSEAERQAAAQALRPWANFEAH